MLLLCWLMEELRLKSRELCGVGSNLLVGYEDVKAVDHINQWNGLVLLPLLDCFDALCHDDEIILLALEVDLDLFGVGACHCESGVVELFLGGY